MSANQFQQANELIKNRQFDEARTLLQSIDHPKATEWLNKLDEIAPPSAIKNQVATFDCTKCFREVGPDMKACDYRDHDSCPYDYIHESVGGSFVSLTSLVVGVMVMLMGVCALSTGGTDQVYLIMSMFCFVPAIIAIVFGLYKFIGMRTRVIDTKTGILWEKESVLGLTVSADQIVETKVIPMPVPINVPFKYPSSLIGLAIEGKTKQQALNAIIYALTTMAIKGHIDFVEASRQEGSVFGLGKIKSVYKIRLNSKPRGQVFLGQLEKRLLLALKAWRDAPKNKNLANDMLIRDLGYYLFVEKEIKEPFDATLAIVHDDAISGGLAYISASKKKAGRVNWIPETYGNLMEDAKLTVKSQDAVRAKYPELIEALEKELKQGLQKRMKERQQGEITRDAIFRSLLRETVRAITRF